MNSMTALEETLTMIHLRENHEPDNLGDSGVCGVCVP